MKQPTPSATAEPAPVRSLPPASLMLNVPLAIPDPQEVRAIIRAAAVEVAERESHWLTAKEAARHCGWSLRTFQRKRDELGIPYSEIYGDPDEAPADATPRKRVPLQRYFRADLDAILAAHMVYPEGAQVITFPSLALRDAQRHSTAA